MSGLFDNVDKNSKEVKVNKKDTVKSKCNKVVKIPDNIFRIKDYVKDEISVILNKERNTENQIIYINNLFLKTIDKVANEFGSKYN